MIILDNPEFIRLRRSKLRTGRMILLGSVTALILGGVLASMYWDTTVVGGWTAKEMLKYYFFTVAGLQLAVITLFGLTQASQNITFEREQHTLDFQRLVAMGPGRLVLGKLFGGPCEAWWIMLCAIPFAIIPVMGLVVPAGIFFQTLMVVFILGLSVSSVGLLFSSIMKKTARSSGAIIFFGFFIFISSGFKTFVFYGTGMFSTGVSLWEAISPIGIMTNLSNQIDSSSSAQYVSMFSLDIPVIFVFIGLHLLVSSLCFVITVRRLTDEEISYISPQQAAIVFAIFQILITSTLMNTSAPSSLSGLGVFHVANAVLLTALAFGLTPSAELLRGRVHYFKRNEHWKLLFEKPTRLQDSPAIFSVGSLCLIYVIESFILSFLFYDKGLSGARLAIILMVPTISLAVAAMLVYLQAYTDTGGFKAGMIALVIALIFPPFILAAMNGSWQYSCFVSPFAYVNEFFMRSGTSPGLSEYKSFGGLVGAIWACPLICAVLAGAFIVLAAMRIRFLIDMNELSKQREITDELKTCSLSANESGPNAGQASVPRA